MAKIQYLIDNQSKERVYPVTHVQAIVGQNGETITEAVNGAVNQIQSAVEAGKSEFNTLINPTVYNSISGNLEDNAIYNLGPVLDTLNVTLPDDTSRGIVIYFETANTPCVLAYPDNTPWVGEDAPVCKALCKYMITILDGICKLDIYTDQTPNS